MLNLVSHMENKEVEFSLNGKTKLVKLKDIQLAVDEANKFKLENNLNYYELMKLENFIEYARLATNKLSEMRSIASEYNKTRSDNFLDFVSTIPKQDKNQKGWSTYILVDTDSDFVKIGRTRNIYRRILELKNNSGRDLELLHLFRFDNEANLHFFFREFRKNGEWFSIPRPTLLEKVESLKMQIQPDIFID